MSRYDRDEGRVARLCEAVAWQYALRITCAACRHIETFDPHAVWWLFQRKGWDDRLRRATSRFRCTRCRGPAAVQIELVREQPTIDALPLPAAHEWKRTIGRFRNWPKRLSQRRSSRMCNLYPLQVRRREIVAYDEALDDWREDVEKDYVSPGRAGPVAVERDGVRHLVGMRWGFPPPGGARQPVVNIHNNSSPFWRTALTNPERRCLVPVTSFQEWSVEPDPATGKKMHWFTVPWRPTFSFGGAWRPAEVGPVFAFLTGGYDGDASRHVVGAIHPKAIPEILLDEDFDRWLQAPIEEALSLASAYPSQLMAVGEVGSNHNSLRIAIRPLIAAAIINPASPTASKQNQPESGSSLNAVARVAVRRI